MGIHTSKNIVISLLVLIMLFLCIHNLCGQESKKELTFQHLSNELSQTSITEILEDSDGFIWFGTQNGVYKYNGTDFQLFEKGNDSLIGLSDGYIENIYEDNDGLIYFGTTNGLSLYDKKIDIITPFPFKNNAKKLQTKFITSIEKYKNMLFLGTKSYGLYRYNLTTGEVKQLELEQLKKRKGSSNHIVKITAIDDKRLLMTTQNAIYVIDENLKIISKHFENEIISNTLKIDNNNYLIGLESGEILNFKISKENDLSIKRIAISPGFKILSITQDKNGDFWLGIENNGLFIYSLTTGNLTKFEANNKDQSSIKGNSIWSLYKARNNVIWVGSFKNGISFYDTDYYKFKHVKNEPYNPNSLSNNIVNCFNEDTNGNLWVGTDGGGLNYWNRTLNSFECYSLKNGKLNTDVILSILRANENELWLGSWNNGITIFNTQNKKYEVWNTENSFLLSNHVMDLKKDSKGRIWIVTLWGGLQFYDPKTKTHKTIDFPYKTNGALASRNSRRIHIDHSGNIWVATQNSGAIKLSENQNGSWESLQYTNQIDKGNLSNNFITSITEDSQGNILIISPTGLNIYDTSTDSIKTITKQDGLISDDIKGIIEDENGFLWLSTSNGIIQYNPSNEQVLNYNVSDGLQGKEFIAESQYKTKNNELIFGGSNGFNIFNTENIKKSVSETRVVLSSLKIFNEPVYPNDDFKILNKHISQTDSLTLSYKHEVVNFEFNALLYRHLEKVQYAYFLEGFETDWNYVGNKKNATYTNLEPGEYTLRIKSTNYDGIWSTSETRLHITITPPFWETWWFRAFLFFFTVLGIYLFFYFRLKSIKKYQITLENRINERTTELRLQKKKLQEVADELAKKNEEIQRFAFSVSHDLKGPLGNIKLITSLIPETYSKKDSPDLEKYLELIYLSCDTMSELITDITKVAKLGKIENKYEILETKEIIDLCAALLKGKIDARNITIQIDDNLPQTYGDKNRFIQVFGNLLDNAVKYMGDQKKPLIAVKAKSIGSDFQIYVSDNGSGMNENDLKKLFSPFERFHAKTTGTGLGLYMTKKIIESHGGTIHAESEGKEKGTTFVIKLPNHDKRLENKSKKLIKFDLSRK